MRYLRITLADAKPFFLRVTRETDYRISGIEVRKDGEQVTGKGFDERQRIIDKSCVVKSEPYIMNVTYAELEKI